MTEWCEFDSAEQLASAAAFRIAELSQQFIRRQGYFRLVLAGGTTPLACYRQLSGMELPMEHWQLFYGDERCLPQNHAQRNHQMVIETGLTDDVAEHHVIPAERGPVSGSDSYQALIEQSLPFDLVLLGIGEDGHTASLFPGHDWNNASIEQFVIPVYDSPKPPAERISLTRQALQQCHAMLVLVSGDNKRDAVHRWRSGARLPIALVSDLEQCQVYVERGLV